MVPPLETVAVLCDWVHLLFGWSSQTAACFSYISATSSLADPGGAGAELLSTLREVQRFSPSGGGSGGGRARDALSFSSPEGGSCPAAAGVGTSSASLAPSAALAGAAAGQSSEELDLHMKPMACFGPAATAGESDTHCIRKYSLLQYASGLLK